jgi:hypothetical protein
MLTPIILLVLMTAPYLISRVLEAIMQREVDLRGAGATRRVTGWIAAMILVLFSPQMFTPRSIKFPWAVTPGVPCIC